jgi:hypothetical protein
VSTDSEKSLAAQEEKISAIEMQFKDQADWLTAAAWPGNTDA